ncbi:Hypothetical_protein [Hexamita inflata]|uniref:Hypothetical_protein n=1 Tax=Hexamita inflata TaxID=28002 RepID=A0AA86R023_9EUKA|nr:Hypothetical protein HINF_LOCUS55385 [Hexamita inflata]
MTLFPALNLEALRVAADTLVPRFMQIIPKIVTKITSIMLVQVPNQLRLSDEAYSERQSQKMRYDIEISLRQCYCVTKFGVMFCHDLRDEDGMIKLSLNTDDKVTVK